MQKFSRSLSALVMAGRAFLDTHSEVLDLSYCATQNAYDDERWRGSESWVGLSPTQRLELGADLMWVKGFDGETRTLRKLAAPILTKIGKTIWPDLAMEASISLSIERDRAEISVHGMYGLPEERRTAIVLDNGRWYCNDASAHEIMAHKAAPMPRPSRSGRDKGPPSSAVTG